MTRGLIKFGAVAMALLWVRHAAAQSTANPHGSSVGACADCHLPTAWRPIRIGGAFRHAERTFPLEGAHATAPCAACHTSLVFSSAPTRCAACHQDVHRGELGVNCARCHTTRSFVDQARLLRLHEETRFPLRGLHATTPCESCHQATAAGQPQFSGRPTTCVGCHRSDYDRAVKPPHASAGFPTNCVSCHSETGWHGAPFDHNATQFPLTGAHQATTCTSCHSDGVYRGKGTACVSCHKPDYDRTATPPHAASAFSTTCATCHTTTRWAGAVFDHNTTQFPLTGGHRAAACTSCHSDGVYHGKLTTCVSCHRPEFDRTASPPHAAAAFSTTCTSCHNTTTWQGAVFDHGSTQFPLTGGHRAVPCTSCHGDGVYHGKSKECVTCHRPDYDRTATPPHAAAAFSTTCTSCHTTTTWQGATFDHSTTQFPLTGGHQAVACTSCHGDGVYHGKSRDCVTCHKPDYDRTATPPHAAAAFSTSCTTCHTTASWQGATFNHSATQFPLTGAHLAASCASCHADGVYHGKSTACVSCHRADYDHTANPSHTAAGYSTDCATCHTSTTTWQGSNFNHSTTQFPLTGAHITVSCASCHGDGVFKGKATACVACHRPDYDRTTTPAHAAAGYSSECTTCHTTNAWQGANFNHNTTQFPLAGAHATVPCASCHGDGVYHGKPTTCVSCHRPEYDRTTTPPHAAAAFATTCASCHNTSTWQSAVFDHNTTQFPLTGAHLTATCASCHGDGVYHGKPTTCVTCHRPDYDRTTTPPHAAAAFSTTCTTCHVSTTTWQGGTFNHSATQFPLTGAHLTATCASCHGDGVYHGKPTTCVSCHRPDYDHTTTPAHAAAGYSTDCATCHTGTTTWQGAVFDHSTTQFPLTGAHLAVACSSCHGDGVFKGKPTTCVSCHQPQYTATATPPHTAAGFSTACTTCHNSTTWLTSSWSHTSTGWALTGIHATTPCASCHGDGVYHGKSTVCSTCHLPAYNATTNPNHQAAHFPTVCESCHTTTTWLGATFNHDAAYFPIYSGSHNGRWTACTDCHNAPTNFAVFTCTTACHPQASTDSKHRGNSNYRYQSSSCYSCHPRGKAG